MTRTTLAESLDRAVRVCAPRAGSLAVTIFGDVVTPQGNTIWLGSLIEAMELFGLNARQVRTAVFRLVREGWLSATSRGRRSYYQFTDFGRRQYAHAAERIYAGQPPPWDGWWTLLMPVTVAPAVRDELRRRLGWQGFGLLGGGLLAHPCARAAPLAETLAELAVGEHVVVWRARTEQAPAVSGLVASAWRLEEVAARFDAFCATFSALHAVLPPTAALDPADSFRLRILLVHEYRRILLGMTELPPALLGPAWPGNAARDLAARLYRATHAAAGSYCSATLHNQNGAFPAPKAPYFERFGGLGVERSNLSAAPA